jgi:predicted RNA binding protein YcfA (HicA-like mRNA interferase family)
MLRSVFSIVSDIYLIIPAGSVPSFPVSARPYTVSLRQTEQWLRNNGFTKLSDRGKGDHMRYQRADGPPITLDGGARELSRRIERTIAKALGMPQHQLRTAISEGRRL